MTDNERAEYCYECRGYGDDYYFDADGDIVNACPECWVYRRDEDGKD